MKILIIGGTVFVGRYLVEAALARGHQVTLFNRGKHNADLFPEVEKLHGDRDGGLSVLEGHTWDAVIDTCGYVPRSVRASAQLLANAANHYTFISSISVYEGPITPGADEHAPLETIEDPMSEDIQQYYGALKVLCERTVEAVFPGRALSIRPGLIIGPHDYIDRFPYWVYRVARGGEVLAPGRPDRPVQLIDARDLAEWTIRMIEQGKAGAYNATGPDRLLTMGGMLDTINHALGSDARFTWVDEAFLLQHEVGIFTEMPYWLPDAVNGMLEVSIDRAVRDGLTFRPLAQSARDAHAWNQTRAREDQPWSGALTGQPIHVGMTPQREADLLAKWHTREKHS